MIRVQIAAASAVVRAGLESLVASSPGLTVTDSYADVVLAAMALEEVAPAQAIVLLGEGAWSSEALRQGVRAILPADASAAEILAAIEAAAAAWRRSIRGNWRRCWRRTAPQVAAEIATPLTARELEVLRMLAEGAANKTIAWKLEITEHTVKFHVAQISGEAERGHAHGGGDDGDSEGADSGVSCAHRFTRPGT